ncbi:MAG: patatin [Hydrogenophilales bacterium 16-64-46]|nr:MAG: patatin [Hydrogenophilales bacterium 12-64-13]OYZ06835.1 MAG: patatin [Hydrogenophilales bacterium 16-64-46]OZA39541.1 MAG: patatin [Hydrogenophilales bacterium 17-64-34]HQS99857.1 patatin-like phospholipase family protein [Thiobacillus sp.]
MAKAKPAPARPRIGLALGGGSARGWAHIGAIRVLEEAGVRPDLVCGTSIGALVGAAYVAGELDRLETWVRSLKLQTVVSFLDFTLGGGLIKGDKLIEFFRAHFVDRDIRELERPYGAVATDLARGREIWLREGGVSDAVRASIALPGLFTPVVHDGTWLVDGGLVNPVPVSLARAMGADFVIAIDLNADILGRHLRNAPASRTRRAKPTLADTVMAQLGIERDDGPAPPAMLDVLASSINIMQVLITRSRLAGEPADAIIAPPLASLGLMEFHRATVAIEAGRRAAEAALPQILERLDGLGASA